MLCMARLVCNDFDGPGSDEEMSKIQESYVGQWRNYTIHGTLHWVI